MASAFVPFHATSKGPDLHEDNSKGQYNNFTNKGVSINSDRCDAASTIYQPVPLLSKYPLDTYSSTSNRSDKVHTAVSSGIGRVLPPSYQKSKSLDQVSLPYNNNYSVQASLESRGPCIAANHSKADDSSTGDLITSRHLSSLVTSFANPYIKQQRKSSNQQSKLYSDNNRYRGSFVNRHISKRNNNNNNRSTSYGKTLSPVINRIGRCNNFSSCHPKQSRLFLSTSSNISSSPTSRHFTTRRSSIGIRGGDGLTSVGLEGASIDNDHTNITSQIPLKRSKTDAFPLPSQEKLLSVYSASKVLGAQSISDDYYSSCLSYGRANLAAALESQVLLFNPNNLSSFGQAAIAKDWEVFASPSENENKVMRRITSLCVSYANDSMVASGDHLGGLAVCTLTEGSATMTLSSRYDAAAACISANSCMNGVIQRYGARTARNNKGSGISGPPLRERYSTAAITSMCGSSTHPHLIFGGGGPKGEVMIFDTRVKGLLVKSASLQAHFMTIASASSSFNRVLSMDVNCSGGLLAVGTNHGGVSILSIGNLSNPIATIGAKGEGIKALAFHPSYPYELSVGGGICDGTIRTYNVHQKSLLSIVETGTQIMQLQYSSGGNLVSTHGCNVIPKKRSSLFSQYHPNSNRGGAVSEYGTVDDTIGMVSTIIKKKFPFLASLKNGVHYEMGGYHGCATQRQLLRNKGMNAVSVPALDKPTSWLMSLLNCVSTSPNCSGANGHQVTPPRQPSDSQYVERVPPNTIAVWMRQDNGEPHPLCEWAAADSLSPARGNGDGALHSNSGPPPPHHDRNILSSDQQHMMISVDNSVSPQDKHFVGSDRYYHMFDMDGLSTTPYNHTSQRSSDQFGFNGNTPGYNRTIGRAVNSDRSVQGIVQPQHKARSESASNGTPMWKLSRTIAQHTSRPLHLSRCRGDTIKIDKETYSSSSAGIFATAAGGEDSTIRIWKLFEPQAPPFVRELGRVDVPSGVPNDANRSSSASQACLNTSIESISMFTPMLNRKRSNSYVDDNDILSADSFSPALKDSDHVAITPPPSNPNHPNIHSQPQYHQHYCAVDDVTPFR